MVCSDQDHGSYGKLRARFALMAVDSEGVQHHLQRSALIAINKRVQIDDKKARRSYFVEEAWVGVFAADSQKGFIEGGCKEVKAITYEAITPATHSDGFFMQRENRRHGGKLLALVAAVEFVLGHLLHLSEQLQRLFVFARYALDNTPRVGVRELFSLCGAYSLLLFHDALRHFAHSLLYRENITAVWVGG